MAVGRVAVAASGGRDSTALLHATTRAARESGLEAVALHVHHGLQPAADAWAAQVQAQARRWGAASRVSRLEGRPARGESVEAWARRGRYQALATMARDAGCSLVLLAHHRRDQAETFLLQALRGGGPRGLSAMPARALREGLVWARPWLDQPREAIEAYVRRHRLAFVDDASNDDPRFARNALRRDAWPALQAAFPQAEAALVQAARRAQQAAALAAEVADADLPALLEAGALHIDAWAALGPARRRNALEAWLRLQGLRVEGALVDRLLAELPRVRQGRWPATGGELRLYRGHLAVACAPAHELEPVAAMPLELPPGGARALPAFGGHVETQPVDAGGVSPARLGRLVARPREGGERFRLAPHGTPRSLKKQYQARAVPAWEREGPLLFTAEGELLFVPGLGIDGAFQAAPGEPQFALRWVPDRRQPGQ